MENIHTLIIPDVHGRTFWKYAIQQYPIEKYPDIKIIFLGDYLDPYTSFEGITKNEAPPFGYRGLVGWHPGC